MTEIEPMQVNRLGLDIQIDCFDITRQQLAGWIVREIPSKRILDHRIQWFDRQLPSSSGVCRRKSQTKSRRIHQWTHHQFPQPTHSIRWVLVFSFFFCYLCFFTREDDPLIIGRDSTLHKSRRDKRRADRLHSLSNRMKETECVGLPNELAVQ